MDKRIIRTRQGLKSALVALIRETPFEKITVTQICKKAGISRITFYTYYNDKFDLLDDCFKDMEKRICADIEARQKENLSNDPRTSIHNVISSVVPILSENLTSYSQLLDNPDLMLIYYRYLLKDLEAFENSNSDRFQLRYPYRQLNSFLIFGLWGYLQADPKRRNTPENQANIENLILDIMNSDIFKKA